MKKNKSTEIVEIMNGSMDIYQPLPSKKQIAVVIGRSLLATGFSMCFAKSIVTSIYLTNQAVREQLRERINRNSQIRDSIEYVTVHGGLLSLIHNRHLDATSVSAVARSLSNAIK
jgi:hypothetical protein